MRVVTCISDPEHAGFRLWLERSCESHGLTLVVLRHPGEWGSHRNKDHHLLRYLESVAGTDVVLFTDGYDTLFRRPQDTIVQRFRDIGAPVLFSAEVNCWPCEELLCAYPDAPTEFRYLNSGGFIGTAAAIRSLLEEFPQPPSSFGLGRELGWWFRRVLSGRDLHPRTRFAWSNQYFWTQVFLARPDDIALDHHSSVFLTLSTPGDAWRRHRASFDLEGRRSGIYEAERRRMGSDLTVEASRLLYRGRAVDPCHVHLNSPVVRMLAEDGALDALLVPP